MRLHGYTPPAAVIADAGPEVSTLGMVAVYPLPDQAEALAVAGGLEPADLHCTLVFLGDAAEIDAEAVTEAVAQVAGEVAGLEGTIGGAGAFAEGPDGVPVILLPDVKGLTMLRERLVEALRDRGVESPSEHGFLPHMTVTYDEEPVGDELASRMGQAVTFAEVSVVVAGERTDYPLDGPLTAGMYAIPVPDEIAAATERITERLQSDEHVDPLAAAYQEVLERLSRRMVKALKAGATVLADGEEVPDRQFVPPDGDEVIDTDALARDVEEVVGAAHREAARVVVAELDYEDVTYDVDTVFTDELLGRLGTLANDILEREARDRYRSTVELAAEQGWSVVDTADALGNTMTVEAAHTARALARTDLNGLANGGSVHVAQQSLAKHPEPVYKTWLATPDERTRDSHVDADGQTVPLNENFTVGGFPMPYPGYPFAPLEEVINCRCTVTYTSDPTGGTAVITDPNAAAADPLAMVTPGDDLLAAGENDYQRWAEGEFWGDHEDALADSPTEYAAQLEAKMSSELAADRATVAIRSPADVAVAIAEDGRFKSQFESQRSGGMLAPGVRAAAEQELFSYPKEHPAEQRPIYGYMRGVTREPEAGLSATVEMYGNVIWNLKHDVRARTTFTANDSLGLNFVPSPIDRPSHLSANPRRINSGIFTMAGDLLSRPMRDWDVAYVEAQVHGGVSLSDVESVEVEFWSDPDVEAALDPYRDAAEQDAHRLRQQLARSGYGHIQVLLRDMRTGLSGSGEDGLGLGHDGRLVNSLGDVDPVAASQHAHAVHGLTEPAVPLVEHPDGGLVDAVAPALDEQHEGVVAALSNDGHVTDDTSVGGGSQPSDPLPFPSSEPQEAPMSTTTDTTNAPAEALEADGNGEIEITPVGWDAVLAVEDEVTEDGRLLVRGSTSWRDLPLSLMGMLETSEYGHVGAKLAGRIDSITRVANDIASAGELTSAFGVNELAPLVADRSVRGVSVDLAVLDWEYRDRDTGATLSEDDLFLYWIEGKENQIVFAVLEGVIVGATVCPMPAIANAEISLAASAGLTAAGRAILADALGERRTSLADVPLIRVFTAFDRKRSSRPLVAAAPLVDLEPATRAHFELTEFPGKTPLTVTEPGEDGWRRVFGHIATWDTCHVGIPGVCTTAPRSYTEPAYALFHQSSYLTREGDTLDVGNLMLGTGHAGLAASRMEATRHYDKPDMVGARVRAIDGEFGIWVSGVARAELTDAGVRELRENPPSGDWRQYNGHLELVAVCAVAVPGFPVVADAQANLTAAGGEVALSALIASSGTITPSDAVKDAMIAAGCGCDDMATSDDDASLDDIAELALS